MAHTAAQEQRYLPSSGRVIVPVFTYFTCSLTPPTAKVAINVPPCLLGLISRSKMLVKKKKNLVSFYDIVSPKKMHPVPELCEFSEY